MSDIFISYRRGVASPYARGIYERLEEQFGGNRVFMDIDTMEPGVDFVDYIKSAVGTCRVLLVVISPDWVSVVDDNGQRRLDDPEDFVRVEVTAALEREDVRVIPVLVGDAPPPKKTELPPDLAPLTRRQALEVNDGRWDYDLSVLQRTIAKVMRGEEPDADAGEPPEPTGEKPHGEEAADEPAQGTGRPSTLSARRRPLLFGGVALLLLAALLVALLAGGDDSSAPGGDAAPALTRGEMQTALEDFRQALANHDPGELDDLLAPDARYSYLDGGEKGFVYDEFFDDVNPVNVRFRTETPEPTGFSGFARVQYTYVDTNAQPEFKCEEGRINGGAARIEFEKQADSVKVAKISDRPYLSWEAEPGLPREQTFIVVHEDLPPLSNTDARRITNADRCPLLPLNSSANGLSSGDAVRVHGQVTPAGGAAERWPDAGPGVFRRLQRGLG